MNIKIHTIVFLYRLLCNRVDKTIKRETITIMQTDGSELIFDHYHPHQTPLATIVFMHGMSRPANREPVLIKISRILASMGYQVLAPLYEDIKNFNLSTKSIKDIHQSLVTFINHHYCTNNKLSIFTASFSGCHALRAIANSDIRDHINCLLLLGSPYRYYSTLLFTFGENKKIDWFSRLLCLRSMLLHQNTIDPELDAALNAVIDYLHDHNSLKRIKKFAEHLSDENARLFCNYIDLIQQPHRFLRTYQHIVDEMDAALEQSGDISNVKAAVLIIHGIYDNTIPCSESEKLFEKLSANHTDVMLVKTTMLSHVTRKFSLSLLKQGNLLFNSFQYFFKNVLR
ncbi:MAG: hypothetical protein AAGA27_01710 [Pseudomonadota bacterium]